ncbi:dTDP-4-dehydrorhamnose 3,5-epimerase family protein [Candidatus Uhrbacteria bacterium]|nr:dTDP-4-dehydrorhamnose 3,5-epimerase family protein [Candidatus Uhrbacteria bacterium]
MQEPILIEGSIGIDDRGEVLFVNGFDFKGVQRFYVISNHRAGFIRAWHAHKKAAKYVYVIQGAVLIGAVAIDNWDAPSKNAKVHRYILSAHKPGVLYIPPGYANGAMTLTEDAKIIYFATDTMEETKDDDYRYDARYWDIWIIEER